MEEYFSVEFLKEKKVDEIYLKNRCFWEKHEDLTSCFYDKKCQNISSVSECWGKSCLNQIKKEKNKERKPFNLSHLQDSWDSSFNIYHSFSSGIYWGRVYNRNKCEDKEETLLVFYRHSNSLTKGSGDITKGTGLKNATWRDGKGNIGEWVRHGTAPGPQNQGTRGNGSFDHERQ